MELTINGQKVTLTHKPITLRNAESLTKWADRLKQHVQTTSTQDQQEFFVELMNKHPDLLDVMTLDGGINPKAIKRYVERTRESLERHNANLPEGEDAVVIDDERLHNEAVEYVKKTVQDMMKDSPAIARIVQFTMPRYGCDLASLKLGIDCIIDTYDTTKHDEATNNAIVQIEAEHWQDVTASEVADYVNNFLQAVS